MIDIIGFYRREKELVPKEAFREALANAIVHRSWDINAYIQIAMFKDRVEINSPGGLSLALSKDDYINKNISILKNPIIAGVFYRLNIIEKFGTGIARIIEEYKNSLLKVKFDISTNYIRVILPLHQGDVSILSEDEALVYGILKEEGNITREELDIRTGFNKSKTIRVINSLLGKSTIKKVGKGPGTSYTI